MPKKRLIAVERGSKNPSIAKDSVDVEIIKGVPENRPRSGKASPASERGALCEADPSAARQDCAAVQLLLLSMRYFAWG